MALVRMQCEKCLSELYGGLEAELAAGLGDEDEEVDWDVLEARAEEQVGFVPVVSLVRSPEEGHLWRGKCPREHVVRTGLDGRPYEHMYDEAVRHLARGDRAASITRAAAALENMWRRCWGAVQIDRHGQILAGQREGVSLRAGLPALASKLGASLSAHRDLFSRAEIRHPIQALRNRCVHGGYEPSQTDAMGVLRLVRDLIRETYAQVVLPGTPGFQVMWFPEHPFMTPEAWTLMRAQAVRDLEPDEIASYDTPQPPVPYASWLYLDGLRASRTSASSADESALMLSLEDLIAQLRLNPDHRRRYGGQRE